jgi:Glucodextranase, domain B/PASTA domain
MPRRRLLAPAIVAVLTLLPAAARATVKASSITVPGGTSFQTNDLDQTSPTPLTVRGTYTADAPSDSVDVRCYGASTLTFHADVGASGAFDTTDSLSKLIPSGSNAPLMNVCRLRAVPHNASPSNLAPFAGPLVAVGDIKRYKVGGALSDVYYGAPQLAAANDYQGLGDCGLEDSLVIDPTTLQQSRRLFFCNDWYSATDTPSGPSRSGLQIDGFNVYAPSAVDGNFDTVNLSSSSNFPAFSFGPTRNPATGDVTITESDALARCTAGNFIVPSGANCPALTTVPVEADRTIAQDHNGRVVRIVDRFVSTDGQAHSFDGLIDNDFFDTTTGYRFPWVDGGAYHQHSTTDALPGAPAGPGTIYVKDDIGAADGDAVHPQGAITFSSPPDGVTFNSSTTFLLRYRRTIPATGALTLVFTYSIASRAAEVAGYAHDAEDQAGSPVVTISNPMNGAVVGDSALNLRGFATDNGGVTSFTVNGSPVALGAGGAWSLPVRLPLGTSTFTATATDRFGNVGSAPVQVTYARCVVPNVRHQKLSSARRHLAKAHCGARVRYRYSSKIKKYRVISQGVKKGKVLHLGRHITLKVSKGRKPRHRHHR